MRPQERKMDYFRLNLRRKLISCTQLYKLLVMQLQTHSQSTKSTLVDPKPFVVCLSHLTVTSKHIISSLIRQPTHEFTRLNTVMCKHITHAPPTSVIWSINEKANRPKCYLFEENDWIIRLRFDTKHDS